MSKTQDQNDDGGIMTLEETSEYLRIPRSSLYRLAQQHKVPCKKIGKHWRFNRQAIDAWVSAEDGDEARK